MWGPKCQPSPDQLGGMPENSIGHQVSACHRQGRSRGSNPFSFVKFGLANVCKVSVAKSKSREDDLYAEVDRCE